MTFFLLIMCFWGTTDQRAQTNILPRGLKVLSAPLTEDTLLMLYFSLVYSRMQCGITLRGTSAKSYMRETNVRQNNVIRSITYSKKFLHVSQLCKHFNLLKLHDVYELEFAKFINLLHNKITVVSSQFTKIEKIHCHNTKQVNNCAYFSPQST